MPGNQMVGLVLDRKSSLASLHRGYDRVLFPIRPHQSPQAATENKTPFMHLFARFPPIFVGVTALPDLRQGRVIFTALTVDDLEFHDINMVS